MRSTLATEAPYLAVDTSGPLGSVAVGTDRGVLSRAFLDRQGRHAADMIPCMTQALAEAHVGARDLAGVVVGAGPGSFTGVRVAAATAKGLVHALRVPLWAISSLAAAAVAERVAASLPGLPAQLPDTGPGRLRYVLFDARGDRLYAACYWVAEDAVKVVVAPHATRLETLLEEGPPAGAWFVGDGALRHEAALRAAGRPVLPPPAGVPTADGLLHALGLCGRHPPVADPGRWEPEYVRVSSAERVRSG